MGEHAKTSDVHILLNADRIVIEESHNLGQTEFMNFSGPD